MKQLERAQLKAVKGGDGWILFPGGVMNLIPTTTLITTTGTNSNQDTNTSTSLLNSLINAIKNKMNNKK